MTGLLPHPDRVAEQADELRLLWPALPAALPRDSGTSGGERVTVSENVHTIPINPAVAATIRRLAPHMPTLDRLTREYADAYTNHRPRDAWPIAHDVGRWLDDARNALGLNRPDEPFGDPRPHCPRHDEPLTPLVTPGDRGELRYDTIGPAGELLGGWIRWTHIDLVVCRHCSAQWTPGQYLWLGRLCADADRRRAAAAPTVGG